MALLRVEKCVNVLPTTFTPNTLYFVRILAGFDVYLSSNISPYTPKKLNDEWIESGTAGIIMPAKSNKISVASIFEELYTKAQLDAQKLNLQTLVVSKNPATNQFSSIVAAFNSITDASITKPYCIEVFGGVYDEPLIDLSSKPYVSVKGVSIQSVIVRPAATNHHVFKIGSMNELSFMTINDAGSGYAGIAFIDGGDFGQAHKISMNNCDIGILTSSATKDCYFYGEYIDFNGVYSYGLKASSANGFKMHVSLENYYNIPSSDTTNPIGTFASGATTEVYIPSSGNTVLGATQKGTCLYAENGAYISGMNIISDNWNVGLNIANVGVASTIEITNGNLTTLGTDIKIDHATGAGSFRGAIDSPTITIPSTSTFGLSYFEPHIGNKQEIFIHGFNLSPVAVVTPTASAAVLATYTTSGLTSMSFADGAADRNACATFVIPKDYQNGGRFKLLYENSTTQAAQSFVIAPILSSKKLTQNANTQNETLTKQTIVAGTLGILKETAWFTPATAFTKGDLVAVRITRACSDTGDTYSGAVYVSGFIFEYNSNK